MTRAGIRFECGGCITSCPASLGLTSHHNRFHRFPGLNPGQFARPREVYHPESRLEMVG